MERIIVAWASLSRFYTNPTRYTIHKVKKRGPCKHHYNTKGTRVYIMGGESLWRFRSMSMQALTLIELLLTYLILYLGLGRPAYPSV
jgi:hypothetical protein